MLLLIAAALVSWPLILVARFFRVLLWEGWRAAAAYLFAIAADGLDQVFSVIATGSRDVTFSTKLYMEMREGRLKWCHDVVDWCFGWRERDHCRNACAMELEEMRSQAAKLKRYIEGE